MKIPLFPAALALLITASLTPPARDIERVSVFRGTRSAAGRGAVIGAVAGGSPGTIAAVAAQEEPPFEADVGEVLLVGALGAGVGAGFGAVVGLPITYEQWEALPRKDLPWRVGLAADPEGGVRLSVSLAFQE